MTFVKTSLGKVLSETGRKNPAAVIFQTYYMTQSHL